MRTITVNDSGISSSFQVYTFGSGSPRVTFTAGIHGNEVSGIYVAEKLIRRFTEAPPQKGTVKIIPRCNPTATRCMQRRSPFDGEDMNRIFPGNANGSISHKIAAALWQETADAEYIVDLHCCGQHGLPYILATYEESPAVGDFVSRIAMPRAIRSEGTPGQLFTSSCRMRGQAAVIIELPSGRSPGAVNLPDSLLAVDGLMAMLASLGMVDHSLEAMAPALLGPLLDVDAPGPGLWEPELAKGQRTTAGQRVGTVDGAPVFAEREAFVMAVRPMGYLLAEDLWVAICAQERG